MKRKAINMSTNNVITLEKINGERILCVDNFLYQLYDSNKRNGQIWVCIKNNDDFHDCRSRITISEVSSSGGGRGVQGKILPKYKIDKIYGNHNHNKFNASEISKILKKVEQINTPTTSTKTKTTKTTTETSTSTSTLTSAEVTKTTTNLRVAAKRKAKVAGGRNTAIQIKRKRNETIKNVPELEEPAEIHEDESEDDEEEADEEAEIEIPMPEIVSKVEIKKENKTDKTETFTSFKEGRVYLLTTPQGRQMACVNGYMYRLEGKSANGLNHRWACIRRRDEGVCKVMILTKLLTPDLHRLMNVAGSNQRHEHEPYTPSTFLKLIRQHNIKFARLNETEKSSSDPLKSPVKKPEKKPIPTTDTSKLPPAVKEKLDILLARRSKPLRNEFKDKQFQFLPSTRGKQVLCMDNFIYHQDAFNHSNNHSYWTCILRRDKTYACRARVTLRYTEDGPVVVNISGNHMHEDSKDNINWRIGITYGDDDKETTQSSFAYNEQVKKEIKKENVKKQKLSNTVKTEVSSSSSYSGNDDHDDDDDNDNGTFDYASDSEIDINHFDNDAALPTKLEDMCSRSKEKVKLKKTTSYTKVEHLDIDCNDNAMDESTEQQLFEQIFDPFNEYQQNTSMSEQEISPQQNDRKLKKGFKQDVVECDEEYELDSEMDIKNVIKLRSSKGGDLLCVDGYIYHVRSVRPCSTYWTCIKCHHKKFMCKSRVTTRMTNRGIKITKVSHRHSHPVFEEDIKRRLYNEFAHNNDLKIALKPKDVLQWSMNDVSGAFVELCTNSKHQKERVERANLLAQINSKCFIKNAMKLYAVSDGPPSLAVRMTLKALNISFELIPVDYIASEHMTEEYAKMNPQKEIPVLDDNGFYLSESIAIMQYLCDKYGQSDQSIYPKNANQRAIVNQRLCFNMAFYYSSISAHAMAPIFFDYPRDEMSLKKVKNSLDVFETYLIRSNTKYAAGDEVTIADFALVSSTLCLEAINYDLRPYQHVNEWYQTFKREYPELWAIGKSGLDEIAAFEKNPPDLSEMNHPFHPTKKIKS